MSLKARITAARQAFKDPTMLEPKGPEVVEVIKYLPPITKTVEIPVEVIREVEKEVRVEIPIGAYTPVAPQTGTRFRIVRHHAGTDTILYAGDAGAKARDAFLTAAPRYVSETITFYDGEIVRDQKVGT